MRPEKSESMSVLQAGLRQNSVIISLLFSSLLRECDRLLLLHYQYETTDKHLSPDGQYVPRIIFVGKIMTFVSNSKTFRFDLLH